MSRFKTADKCLTYAQRRGYKGRTVTQSRGKWEIVQHGPDRVQGPFSAVLIEPGVTALVGEAVSYGS